MMLDKLVISTDFADYSEANLIGRPVSFRTKSKEATETLSVLEDGQKFSKLYYNSENLVFEVRPVFNFENISKKGKVSSISKITSRLQFNPNKLLLGNNTSDISRPEQLQKSVEIALNELKENKILIELERSRISRFDVGSCLQPPFSSSAIVDSFMSLPLSRRRNRQFEETVYSGNKSRYLAVYNKSLESEEAIEGSWRIEERVFKTGIKNAESVLASGMVHNIKDVLGKTILTMRKSANDRNYLTLDVKSVLERARESGRRYWLSEALQFIGYAYVELDIGTDAISDLFDNLSNGAKGKLRELKRQKTLAGGKISSAEKRDCLLWFADHLEERVEKYAA